MQTILPGLSSFKGVEEIFILGSQTHSASSHTIFSAAAFEDTENIHYLLLALTDTTANNKSIEEILESKATPATLITAWAVKKSIFLESFNRGDYFAMKVLTEAGKLSADHTAIFSAFRFTEKPMLPPPAVDVWLNRSNEFIAGAQLYIVRKQPGMAAFLLHQAAEQAYTAIICKATGFRPQIHNLLRLHRYAGFFIPGLLQLFPDHTDKNECLLHRLQKAYIDCRYSETFYLPLKKINELTDKIILLRGMAGKNISIPRS